MKPVFFPIFVLGLLLLSGCSQTASQRTAAIADAPIIVPLFFIESHSGASARTTEVSMIRSGETFRILRVPVLDVTHLHSIHLVQVDLGMALLFQMNSAGARELFRITMENPGRRLIVALNNTPAGMRLIEGTIRDGRLFMFVDFAAEDMPLLAEKLQDSLAELQRRL